MAMIDEVFKNAFSSLSNINDFTNYYEFTRA